MFLLSLQHLRYEVGVYLIPVVVVNEWLIDPLQAQEIVRTVGVPAAPTQDKGTVDS